MTDDDLQTAITSLDALPRHLTTDADRKRRAGLLAAILGALRERGGSFVWNGLRYRENPVGVLSRGLPFG